MSKAKSDSDSGNSSGARWATSATISENTSQQGVELHFNTEPHPELQSKLRVKGFLPSKLQTMWYAKKTDVTKQFAEAVKHALPAFLAGPHVRISPSFEPIKANVESKRFSFVMIVLKGGEEKGYIVFEPSKPRAEVIALNFAHHKFSGDFMTLAVSPRSKMRESRMLFDEGRIIHEVQLEGLPEYKVPVVAQEDKIEPASESEPAEALTVTIGGEKANLSLILHEFHTWLKDHPEHKGSTKIPRSVYTHWLQEKHPEVNPREADKIWDRHERLVKILHRIGKLDTKQITAEPYSSIYKKLLKIIPGLMEHLESGEHFSGKSHMEGYMDLHFDYLFKDKKGYNIALAHYTEQNGDLISDPDMQIRIIPEMKMAEAMTFQNIYRYDEVYSEEGDKELVDLKMKSQLNTHLNEWLSTLISYGHQVKLIKESERYADELDDPAVQVVHEDNSQVKLETAEVQTATPVDVEASVPANTSLVPALQPSVLAVASLPSKDSLTNGAGIYNAQSAGDHFQIIDLPTPASTYKIKLQIVKTSFGDYRTGFALEKEFGQRSGRHYQPAQKNPAFLTRAEAIEELLAEIIGYCNDDKDSESSSEKKENLNGKYEATLEAIYKFAEGHGYDRNRLEYKSKAVLFNIELPLVVPVPELKVSASKTGISHRISQSAHDQINQSLTASGCEVFYYDSKAWRLEKGNLQRLPDLDTKAVKYFKNVYQKTDAYKQLSKLMVRDSQVSKRAYELLKHFIPGLDNLVGKKAEATLTFKDKGEERSITCFFREEHSQLFIVEYIDNDKHLESDIRIVPEDQEAYVTMEWLSDYYADRYDRLDEDGELAGDDMALGEDMTRGLTEWLGELIEQDHKVDFEHDAAKGQAQTDVFTAGYDGLKRIIPDLDLYMKGKKKKAFLEYELLEEKKKLSCEFIPGKSTLVLIESMDGKKQMETSVRLNVGTKEARVTEEWMSDYYAEGLGRHEPDAEIIADEHLNEKDMTRAFVQWLGDLLEARVTVSISPNKNKIQDPLAFLNEPLVDEGATGKLRFNPVVVSKLITEDQEFVTEWQAAYKEDPKAVLSKLTHEEVRRLKDFYNTFILSHANKEEAYRLVEGALNDDYFEIIDDAPVTLQNPQLERSFSPADEKLILNGFKEMGFTSPFNVKQAFDRNLSVTDVGLRYQSTEQFYKKEIAGPARKREKALNAEQKEHKYKTGTKKEAAIRSELWEIGVRLLRGEEYYKKENQIFKDDFFEAVLKIVAKKGLTFSNQADLESFIEFVDGSVFDENTFEDYHRERIDELVERLIGEYFHEQAKNIKAVVPKDGAVAIDIMLQGKAVPNVLVPAGTKEPFWSNHFNIYDMEEVIKNNFPHLRKLTSKTLFKATPIEMYELIQMSHPTDSGLKVDRFSVLREWEKRGKELFTGIGFPTDDDYPYVNIHTGYTSIETLKQLLFEYNKDGNHWWGVAEHSRPIADPAKALDYIGWEIDKLKKSIKECVNPKTNKPTSAKKEEYRDLSFDLGYLESGKAVLENYLKRTKALPANKPSTAKRSKTEMPDLNELSAAFWKPEDEKNPANKAVIYGQEFDLVRLRQEFERLLAKIPLTQHHLLVKELSKKYPLAYDLEYYAKGLVTIGKTGAKRERSVLNGYMHNIVIKHDLPVSGKREYKVCSFIINKLLSSEESQPESQPAPLVGSYEMEEIIIPFPKTSQFEGRITIAHTVNDIFVVGTQYRKGFGSQTFQKTNPGDNGKQYGSREAAITDGILELQDRLRVEMQHKDSLANSETKKNAKVKKAMDALLVFAKEHTASGAEENSNSENNQVVPAELKPALWLPEDGANPVDKAEIDGILYHQSRLREVLIALIGELTMEKRLALAEDLASRFHERRPMQEYLKDHVNGTGRFGKKKFTGAYYDDMIIDNDLMKHDPEWKVCKYLISVLIRKDNLVDKIREEKKPELRKIPKTDQHKLNKEIEALIDEKDAKGAAFSVEEKDLMRQYAGSGGLLKQGAKGRGVLYEYYTPDWLVEQMWGLARRFGYDGGSVLEPSVGIGNFLKYAPEQAIISGFETNHYSARIAQLLYPHAQINEKAFESLFFEGNVHLKDSIDYPLFSLVIGNPPYGEFTGKYAGMGEKKWTGALEYDQYFMLRCLDLLQPGGLMVFLVPSLFIQSGQKYNKTKDKINTKAEVLMCYRLPQNLFATTDIGTDIIVLRKRAGTIIPEKQTGGIDEETLPAVEAQKPMKCSITGLKIDRADRIFYDKKNQLFIKALKIKGGDNPGEIYRKNPWLSKIIKTLFENYMAKHGDRNELREKYYGEDAIYDPALVLEAGLEYIHEVMFDSKVSACWLHKIDITEAFAD